MSAKPKLLIDLATKATGALPALCSLAEIGSVTLYNDRLHVRHPLGVYNLSIGRVCQRISRCCAQFEQLNTSASSIVRLQEMGDALEQIVDSVELCLYAAAEHVDDAKLIVDSFFPTEKQCKKSRQVKEFEGSLKRARDRIAAVANALKHHQARIRLYSVDFLHDGHKMCLHGFYVETCNNGIVGPSPIFHAGVEKVISLPSFLWEITVFLFEASTALRSFFDDSKIGSIKGNDLPCDAFARACIALTRLPNYSFDGAHPFERVTVVIFSDPENDLRMSSPLYGSIKLPWTESLVHEIGGYTHQFEGDGVSRSFALVQPSSIRLQHWNQVN